MYYNKYQSTIVETLYTSVFFKDIDFEIRRRACSTSLQLFELRFETILNVLIFGMCLKAGDAHIGRLYTRLFRVLTFCC